MKPKSKPETIYPIGFLQSFKKTWLFARTIENPDNVFLITNKKKSPTEFSQNKEKVVIKNKLFTRKLHLEEIDHLVSSYVNGKEIITFVYGKNKNKKLLMATAKKENIWSIEYGISTIKERGGIVSDYLYKKEYHIAYYGESSLWVAASSHFKKWVRLKEPVLKARPGFFDHGDLKFLASRICEKGILVFYDASVKDGKYMKLQIGAALFSLRDPKKLIWRADTALFEQTVSIGEYWECKGTIFSEDSVSFYWYAPKQGIFTVSLLLPFGSVPLHAKGKKLKRSESNPIVSPQKTWWQTEGTFNPAAVEIDGTTHLLFRAIGEDGVSRVGYAATQDGHTIDEVHPDPVFHLQESGSKASKKRYDPVMYPSGGSWGGCEDPRMVKIDDTIYMTFNAFDSWNNIRVGYAAISEEDFLNKEWNWSEPTLLSPRGQRHKNWVLFPEKIHGKFALLHNINAMNQNQVYVEYFDSLDPLAIKNKKPFESPDPQLLPNRPIVWHLRMRSMGPPPIKTDAGWLVLYHATDANPSQYKMGAMLLDLNDPTKIIARSVVPILTPDMWYENDWKPGIVYACGAVIKNDTLFIYYGGGDKHVCVATTPLAEFLASLKNSTGSAPSLTRVSIS